MNTLAELLRQYPIRRRAADYEAVYDDFIRFAGGDRVSTLHTIPYGVLNADYHLVTGDFELVIELKQMQTYRREKTLDAWFNRLIHDGHYTGPRPRAGDRLLVEPQSFSSADWRRFYLKFRPSVTEHLDKAARQLKATSGFLPPPADGRPRFHGAVLLNSNDFNLSTDLLHRLVECRTREKWKRGLYSHMDFVVSTSVDLAQQDRHPQHSRCIVRSTALTSLVQAMRFLFDRWVHYGAAAVGVDAQIAPDPVDDPIRVDTEVIGKLHWLSPDATAQT